MTRWDRIAAAALLVVLSAHHTAAQLRSGQGPGQPAPASGHVRQVSPQPRPVGGDGRTTSILKFVPPLEGIGPAPFPFFGPLWEFFDFVPFGSWSMATPWPAAAAPLPEDAPSGGLQLDVQPWRAEVYVDGSYVGLVEDFRGYYHHLDLVAGPHLIGVVAPGYRPLILEVMVSPDQTTTYRGTLSRADSR